MRAGVVVWLSGVVLLLSAAAATARDPHDLGDQELQLEMIRNPALGDYVTWNGAPDVAEVHFLADAPPWDKYEVTLYYFDMRKEIGFARAWILGWPNIYKVRYERQLSDSDIATLQPRARQHSGSQSHRPTRTEVAASNPAPPTEVAANNPAPPAEVAASDPAPGADVAAGNPAERAEAAAVRAENAAGRVEAAAESTERAADRAEVVVSKLERPSPK